jgi:phosphatidylglycerophosphate synthase
MDGMVAVEGQRSGRFGALYNEIPDRISDVVILLGAGFGYGAYPIVGLSSVTLGWLAALLAILTAYVRLCGVTIGVGHVFIGPMAKPHRMALLTIACFGELVLIPLKWWIPLMPVALLIISIGCVVTLVRRMQRIINIHGGA